MSLDSIGLKYAYNFGKGKQYVGGDKTSLGKNYTETYDELFSSMRNNKINLLELGVFHGRSLAMWSDYLPNGHIVGIDIDLEPYRENEDGLKKHGAFKNDNVSVIEQDVTKNSFGDVVKSIKNMDIIIDDALHQAEAQYNNFKLLFHKLNKGGIYVIEDVVDPIKHMELFKNIYAGTINGNNKFGDWNISNKVESIIIKSNMVIIKKK